LSALSCSSIPQVVHFPPDDKLLENSNIDIAGLLARRKSRRKAILKPWGGSTGRSLCGTTFKANCYVHPPKTNPTTYPTLSALSDYMASLHNAKEAFFDIGPF